MRVINTSNTVQPVNLVDADGGVVSIQLGVGVHDLPAGLSFAETDVPHYTHFLLVVEDDGSSAPLDRFARHIGTIGDVSEPAHETQAAADDDEETAEDDEDGDSE